MRSHVLIRMVSLLLVAVVPAMTPAAELGAMMYPAGAVRLNGVATTRASSVLPGDRLETGANSALTLTASGTSVQIVGLSAATFVPGVLSISSGAATINTTAGMKARLRNLTIGPAAQSARFSVGERGNRIYIASLVGRVQIQDGRAQMMLDAGHAVTIPVPSTDTQGGAGGAGGAGAGAGVGTATAVAVGVAGAALGTGLTAGFTDAFSPSPASPAK